MALLHRHLRHFKNTGPHPEEGATADRRVVIDRHEDCSARFQNLAHGIAERDSVLLLDPEICRDPLFVEAAERAFIAGLKRPEAYLGQN